MSIAARIDRVEEFDDAGIPHVRYWIVVEKDGERCRPDHSFTVNLAVANWTPEVARETLTAKMQQLANGAARLEVLRASRTAELDGLADVVVEADEPVQ